MRVEPRGAFVSSTFPIRSSSDIWTYLDLLAQGRDIAPYFHKGMRLNIRVPEGIDEMRRAEALIALRRMVWRHYGLIKYGTPSLKHLTARDRAESSVTVERTDHTTLSVDFSGALNACVRAAEQRRHEAEAPRYEQTRFPDDLPPHVLAQAGERKDIGRLEAARDVAVNWFNRLTSTHRVATAFFTIACLAVGLTTLAYFKLSFDHDVQVVTEDHRHTEKMAALDEPTITGHDGKPIRLERKDRAKHDHATHEDNRRFAGLDSAYENEPAYRLVKDELDDVRPALMKLAMTGPMEFNGLSFDAKSAQQLARKALGRGRRRSGARATRLCPEWQAVCAV